MTFLMLTLFSRPPSAAQKGQAPNLSRLSRFEICERAGNIGDGCCRRLRPLAHLCCPNKSVLAKHLLDRLSNNLRDADFRDATGPPVEAVRLQHAPSHPDLIRIAPPRPPPPPPATSIREVVCVRLEGSDGQILEKNLKSVSSPINKLGCSSAAFC